MNGTRTQKIKRQDIPPSKEPIERFPCPVCNEKVVRYEGEPERDQDDRCCYCRTKATTTQPHTQEV